MDWKTLLAYITGTVDQERLLRHQYLVTENRILRHQIQGRVRLSTGERKALAEIGLTHFIRRPDVQLKRTSSGQRQCLRVRFFPFREATPKSSPLSFRGAAADGATKRSCALCPDRFGVR
jgi:hypothetical protein